MSLSIGIVGLPNVGKSTLFTALTSQTGFAANYPFATIDPNVGIVPVVDNRLDELAKIDNPKKIVPATVEFVDIAGLVSGASKGEGLGNKFLANIRECDAIAEVVRFFHDDNIVHVEGKVDPISDVETIKTELILADIKTVENALTRLEKEAKRDKKLNSNVEVCKKVLDTLNNGNRALTLNLSDKDKEKIYDLHLLTMKPILYIANCSEDMITKKFDKIDGCEPIPVCCEIESELIDLSEEERSEYLLSLGLKQSSLVRLVNTSYDLLGLQSFFTSGEKETRAWTIKKGSLAPSAAGVIHTDFERGFIMADTASYSDYIEYGGEVGCREAGKLRQEGKDYVVQDGDVMHFKFNV